MDSWSLESVLTAALAAFFMLGSGLNAFHPPSMNAYQRWGYPAGFNYVTSALELTSAALLIFTVTRTWGILLASAIMVAAFATLVIHREYKHSLAPLTVLALLLTLALR